MRKLIFRNVTAEDIVTDEGLIIPAGEEADVSFRRALQFEDDEQLITSITNGDIIVNDGTRDLNATDGIDYFKLVSHKTVSDWAKLSIIQVGKSTNQPTNGTSHTSITWDIEDINIGTAFSHSTTTNPEEVTINEDGTYEIYCRLCTNNTRNNIILYIQLQRDTGSGFQDVPRFLALDNTSNAAGDGTSLYGKIQLNAGDKIRIQSWFNTTSTNYWLANSSVLSIQKIQNLENTLSPNTFSTINTDSGYIDADSGNDTATFTSSNNILSISGDNTTDTITFNITQSNIDHNQLLNTHNLTTDIDHNQLTNYDPNRHFLMSEIDHGSLHGLDDDDHGAIYPGLNQSETITGDWDHSGGRIRLPQGTAPYSSYVDEGDIFWNSQSNVLYIYNGTSWQQINIPLKRDLPALQARNRDYQLITDTWDILILDTVDLATDSSLGLHHNEIYTEVDGVFKFTCTISFDFADINNYPDIEIRALVNDSTEIKGSHQYSGQITYNSSIKNRNQITSDFIIKLRRGDLVSFQIKSSQKIMTMPEAVVVNVVKLEGVQGPPGESGNAFTVIQCPSGTSPIANGAETLKLESSDSTIKISGNQSDDTIDLIVNQNSVSHSNLSDLDQDDHGAVYPGFAQNETISGQWTFGDASNNYASFGLIWRDSAPTSNLQDGQLAYIDGMIYFYDAWRGKWLSIETIFIGAGRNGYQSSNSYLRAFNGMVFRATNGWLMPFDGTVVSLQIVKRSGNNSTIQVRSNGTAIASLSFGGSGAIGQYLTGVNADFNAGDVLTFYNTGSSVTDPIVWARIKWRK